MPTLLIKTMDVCASVLTPTRKPPAFSRQHARYAPAAAATLATPSRQVATPSDLGLEEREVES